VKGCNYWTFPRNINILFALNVGAESVPSSIIRFTCCFEAFIFLATNWLLTSWYNVGIISLCLICVYINKNQTSLLVPQLPGHYYLQPDICVFKIKSFPSSKTEFLVVFHIIWFPIVYWGGQYDTFIKTLFCIINTFTFLQRSLKTMPFDSIVKTPAYNRY